MKCMYDVVILGGGASGLGAVKGALKEGASVILIEREASTGGVLNQCIHTGFGLKVFNKELTGPEFHELYMSNLENFDTLFEASISDMDFDKNYIYGISKTGLFEISFKAIVLATGARERPFESLRIPGERPSGIFTAGLAQKFINVENCLPGKRAAIIGSGDIGMIMARRFVLEGIEVEGVYEILPYPGGLTRNVYQCLMDYNIPLYLSTSVVEVHGKSRLEGVNVAKFHGNKPVPGTERFIEVDTLVASVGLIPENDLVKSNIEKSRNGGLVVDDLMRTNIPNVFAAGNNIIIHDLVDFVAMEGETAGIYAARFAKGNKLPERKSKIMKKKGISAINIEYATLSNPFILYLRVDKPMKECNITVNGKVRKTVLNAKPSEMIELEIDPVKEKFMETIEIETEER